MRVGSIQRPFANPTGSSSCGYNSNEKKVVTGSTDDLCFVVVSVGGTEQLRQACRSLITTLFVTRVRFPPSPLVASARNPRIPNGNAGVLYLIDYSKA